MKRKRRRKNQVHGVLVVDKPAGLTSHDVVVRARKALRTGAIGHAGTLDPRATGVLVLAIGEGTKLVPILSGDDKEYEAQIALGAETDTLDTEGEVVRCSGVPDLERAQVERAARKFVGHIEQRAPAYSAIKKGGESLHERARRGEKIEAPLRKVVVHEIEVHEVSDSTVSLRMVCGKGFYVRSFARDLARELGTVGHLASLRRIRSGIFEVGQAVAVEWLEAAASDEPQAQASLLRALRTLEDACRGLPQARLTVSGAEDARHGRPVDGHGCELGGVPQTTEDATVALIGPEGGLVALGRRQGEVLRVVRGFPADHGAS